MQTTYAVGVDVGGTHLAAGLVERSGRAVRQTQTLTPTSGPFAIVDAVIDLIAEATSGTDPSRIAGVGIGLPALIDFRNQSIEFCANLPLAAIDVRSVVASRVHLDVTLDNDSNCAAIGESRYGAATGVRDFVMITLGTGVGGALLLNGALYRGSRGFAGEIGHMVVRLGGPQCSCGGLGHLESYLGRPAIAARGRDAARISRGGALRTRAGGDPDAVTAEHVVQAALAGDSVACGILLEAGEILGEALVGIVNLLNPRLVVIGGGIAGSADMLVARAADVVGAKALAGRRDVTVVQALLGNDAGVLGAAALALDEHDSREVPFGERAL
ncbi:MAG: ROK family protein [Actinomycetia bacterium]|nr:ROK family protein [Actinomycetes bacterium]